MVRTGPFACDEQWATLVASLEASLRLHRHRPGSLPELARYLHQRTGGMIGSLLWLIRSAAIQAVIDGTEQVTRKAMDTIPVDIASQAAISGPSQVMTDDATRSHAAADPARPAAGEPVSSYVRRLARANHLRSSYLHGCLARRTTCAPSGRNGSLSCPAAGRRP